MSKDNIFDIGHMSDKRRREFFWENHNAVGELCNKLLNNVIEDGDAMIVAISLRAASDKIMEQFIEIYKGEMIKSRIMDNFNNSLGEYEKLLTNIHKDNLANEGENDG